MGNMKKQANLLFRCVLVWMMIAVFACSDAPPVQPKTVSKPIAVQKIKQQETVEPAKSPVAKEEGKVQPPLTAPAREAAAQQQDTTASEASATQQEDKVPQPELKTDSPLQPEQEKAGGSVTETLPMLEPLPLSSESSGTENVIEVQTEFEPGKDKPSQEIKGSVKLAGSYDPKDRFDPFEPLFKAQQADTIAVSKSLREKRVPQTPLERVALSQLKVTAIIRSATGGNRALVEDAGGKGYVVQRGTYIGLNAGRVIDIDKSRIVVEEEIENIMGELTIQNAELKLQKPAGEL
jgi:Tfp pilus assembly protein PilP